MSTTPSDPVEARTSRTNPLWGDDWREVALLWPLDPDIAFLNHGSFGATPLPVLDRQATLRIEMERNPVAFMRRLPDAAAAARAEVARFLGADPDGCAFVTNATAGVNTVLASLELRPGDRLVTTDHAYGAIRNAMARAASRTGATLMEAPIPLPLPEDERIVEAVTAAIDGRTRLVVVDHVTSPTAAILPVKPIVEACRGARIPVMVDAAHAPGMFPVDVSALGADFWTGNLHKWVCAPKGAGVLWVAPEHRDRVRPLVTSHGAGEGFRAEFDWWGTHDPTPYLAAPAAIAFMATLGWDRVRAHNHELVALGRETVAAAAGTEELVDDGRSGSMCVVELPDGWVRGADEARGLEAAFRHEHGVEVPVMWWGDRGVVRLSAQVYNAPADYERLAAGVAARSGEVGYLRERGAPDRRRVMR